ncbi:MAG TPA: LysR substrate-binding domain-containing protein, partial [Ramlibacter sp.]|nr:LysR substrate-binding domain-containing protein [Ramlibacter sp.]
VGFFPPVLEDLAVQEQAGRIPAFDRERLFGGEYVCVMRKRHPLARVPLTLKRFCEGHHLRVSFSGRPFGFVDEALMALGRQRRVVLTVNQFFTAGRVVATSDLLTVLPRHFVSVTGMADQFVLRDLPFELPLVLVDSLWHRRQGQRSDHAWLRAAVATAAQKAFAERPLNAAGAVRLTPHRRPAQSAR